MLTQGDIIYFVITDRFCDGDPSNNFDVDKSNPNAYHGGDFAGIIKRIPYLKKLGITALWITPVYINIHLENRGMWGYHGYWPLDFEKIDPHLYSKQDGVPDGSKIYLKQLVDALHENGIKVVLDMVVNHTGYNHPGLKSGPDTPVRPYWYNQACLESVEEGRLMGLPDLDQDNIDVVDYFINTIIDWIQETGIDCIRMDTAKHVEKAFWYHFKTYVKGKHSNVSLLGEVLEWDIDRISEFQKYYAFDFLFDFPLQQAMTEVFINDKSLVTFAYPHLSSSATLGVLDKDTHYTNHNRLVTLLDNHDLPKRFISTAMDHFNGDRAYAAKIYKLSMSFMMTTRGVPQIFYGNEIALEGHEDPDNRRDMPWHLFDESFELKQEYPIERDIFNHTKRLIEIRRANECLSYGSLITLYVDSFIYAYLREFRGNVVITVINNGHQPMKVPLTIAIDTHSEIAPRIKGLMKDKTLINLFDTSDSRIQITGGAFSIKLEGKTAGIYRLADS
ncbi:MAG: hypothetical protein HQL10_08920 [Nitrospirae bacterium]|nr:hypothetical protein [Nitrospirota bacterium]